MNYMLSAFLVAGYYRRHSKSVMIWEWGVGLNLGLLDSFIISVHDVIFSTSLHGLIFNIDLMNK